MNYEKYIFVFNNRLTIYIYIEEDRERERIIYTISYQHIPYTRTLGYLILGMTMMMMDVQWQVHSYKQTYIYS